MSLFPLARFFLALGVVFLLLGGLLYLAARANLSLFNLPGDIRIESGNFTCIFALGASILFSVVLTVVLNLLARLLNE